MDPFADLVPKKNTAKVSANNPFADLTPGYQPPVSRETSAPHEEKKGFWGHTKDLAKSLVTAPATIVARPLQLGAELIMPGDNTEAIDRFSREKLGGIVAPIPKNFGDVEKDVGRGIQTVALGTGAPIAGGAAFGLGSSLEQGNDLFSVETAFNTVLGAGAGKVLDLVGKPLLNATGKAVGVITPKVLKDVAAGGAEAITKFAAQHELLGGVAKGVSEKIAGGFQAVDDKAGSLFKGAGTKAKDVISSQYPGISKEGLEKRYSGIEAENFAKPTTENSASYKKATKLYNDAKAGGNDLSKTAIDNGIRHDTLIEGGKYNTLDTADGIRTDAMKTSHDLMRPALEAAEPGVERVPIQRVRESMIQSVDNIPKSQITDAERATIKDRINKEYGDNSAAAKSHAQGYTLTDLHDSKIATSTNANYRTTSFEDSVKSRQYKEESAVFRKLLEEMAPPELGIKEFNKAIQNKFQLADYLEALHTKKVPMTVVSKAVDLFGKVAGATVGSKLGGGLGGVAGYHLGGVLFDSFERLPNPLKASVLKNMSKTQPEIFAAFKQYLGDQEVLRLMRLQLPAPSSKISPDLMKKANERGAVEMGYPSRPTTEGERLQNNIQQNGRRLFNTRQLPSPTAIYKGPTQNDLPYTPNRLFGTTPAVETKPKRNAK